MAQESLFIRESPVMFKLLVSGSRTRYANILCLMTMHVASSVMAKRIVPARNRKRQYELEGGLLMDTSKGETNHFSCDDEPTTVEFRVRGHRAIMRIVVGWPTLRDGKINFVSSNVMAAVCPETCGAYVKSLNISNVGTYLMCGGEALRTILVLVINLQ
jgi:hypothetical protein